jgi:uncharacterized protein YndB with AHSA1/START domain
MSAAKKSATAASYEMTTTRIFNVPRKLVFEAWTNPKYLALWWGPAGFTTTLRKWDVRKGGAILLDMNAPNGVVYPMSGRFEEVTPPERIAFTSQALDKAGNPIFECLNTISLLDEGAKTRITVHARVLSMRPDATQYLNGQKKGWGQSLDRLEAFVAGKA